MEDHRKEYIDALAQVKEKVRRRINEAILTILMYAESYRSYGSDFSFTLSEELFSGVNQALIALSDGCLEDAKRIIRYLLLLLEMDEEYDTIMENLSKDDEEMLWAFDMHSSNLQKILLQFITIGFAQGISTSLIFANILSYMEAPDASKAWRDAIRAKMVDPNELRFGSGYQRNIVNAVTVLEQSLISTFYNEALRMEAEEEGYDWYEIFRGSTYDCEVCDSYLGIRIPITERILPIHPRCMCYALFRKDIE